MGKGMTEREPDESTSRTTGRNWMRAVRRLWVVFAVGTFATVAAGVVADDRTYGLRSGKPEIDGYEWNRIAHQLAIDPGTEAALFEQRRRPCGEEHAKRVGDYRDEKRRLKEEIENLPSPSLEEGVDEILRGDGTRRKAAEKVRSALKDLTEKGEPKDPCTPGALLRDEILRQARRDGLRSAMGLVALVGIAFPLAVLCVIEGVGWALRGLRS